MKTWKKVVSLLLAAALVVPGVDFGTLLQVKAAVKQTLDEVTVSPSEVNLEVGDTAAITAEAKLKTETITTPSETTPGQPTPGQGTTTSDKGDEGDEDVTTQQARTTSETPAITWSWTIDNDDVAIVTGDNAKATVEVEAVGEGTATLTVTATCDGKSVQATCTVNVSDTEVPPVDEPTYTVVVSPDQADLSIGDEKQLSATVSPDNAAEITWSSSNAAVATVSNTGLVKAVAKGTAVITASVVIDNKTYTKQCTINVLDPNEIVNVIIRSDTSEWYVGDPESELDDKVTYPNNPNGEFGKETLGIGQSLRLEKYPYPLTAGYDEDNSGWSTDNPSIATVSQNGTVRGISEGRTYIRAYIDGVSSAFRIDVDSTENHTIDIDIVGPTSVGVHQEKTLVAKVIGDNEAKVNWTTDNALIATVDDTGKVTGINKGTTYIRARATCEKHGMTVSSSVKIEVMESDVPDVTGVAITNAPKDVKFGDNNVTLTATVSPDNANPDGVTWESTNEDWVKVDKNGKLTVKREGVGYNVTIIATSKADTSKSDEVTIAIKSVPVENLEIKIKDNKSTTIMVGETLELEAKAIPENAVISPGDIAWSTDNPQIAVVDGNGVVYGLKNGKVKIRAGIDGDDIHNVSSMIEITVKSFAPDIKNIIITGPSAVNTDETITLQAEVLLDDDAPDDVSKEVIWTSNDPTTATVGDNVYNSETGLNTCVITPVKAGKVTIRARSMPGSHGWTVSSAYEITVTENTIVRVTSVEIKNVPTDNIVKVGTPVDLDVTVLPEDATYKNVTWTSDNEAYATVDESGVVTALAAGVGQKVTITATSVGNTTIFDEVELTIQPADVVPPTPTKVESITVAADAISLEVGQTTKVKETVLPADADNKAVTWSASNGNATVDENGNVTAMAEGTVDIIATAKDGSGKSGKVTITITKVTPPVVTVESVTVTGTANVNAGNAVTLTATVKMSDGTTNKDVTWKSSNTSYATVNASGKVTTKAAGAGKTVTITATAKADGSKKGTLTIKIKKVDVKKIAFNKAPKQVKIGKSVTLNVKFTPAKPTNTNVTWALDKASKRIATLKNGKLTVKKTAKKGQKIKVTVTSKDNNKIKATVTIKVAK